ncbi:hypothetical protein VIGAN_05135400 [Vigna angularis var. angularis]|uniref:Uncharacterized protein n=1 Tax=Vigna angularis var. angularis TaxID=157739 RepID=A0A0S3S520_PHAAN|nr:hypothetical protein VIGAN_05135400 [Vigna angularis var. angularis]
MEIGVLSDSTNQLERLVSTPISSLLLLSLNCLPLQFDSFKAGSELTGMLPSCTTKFMFSLSIFSGCTSLAFTTLSIGFSNEQTSGILPCASFCVMFADTRLSTSFSASADEIRILESADRENRDSEDSS